MKPKAFASFVVIVSLLVTGFVILAQPRPSVSPLISPLPTAAQPAVGSPTPQDVVAATRTPFPTLAITPPRLPLPTYTAAPTPTPIVFATPVLSATPSGTVPTQGLMSLWYAAHPASNSNLKLMAVVLDENGNTRGSRFGDGSIDLGLGPRGNRPGEQPALLSAQPSPNGLWATLMVDFRPAVVADLSTGKITTDSTLSGYANSTWLSDSSAFIPLPAQGPGELRTVKVPEKSVGSFAYPGGPTPENEREILSMKFSPDGLEFLDSSRYNDHEGVRPKPMTEIGITDVNSLFRRVLTQSTGAYVGGAVWISKDEIVFVSIGPVAIGPDSAANGITMQGELWSSNARTLRTRKVADLGASGNNGFEFAALPNSGMVYVRVERDVSGKETSSILCLYTSDTNAVREIARFNARSITGISVSPDGKRVALVAGSSSFGEVWLVDIDSPTRRMVAGPVGAKTPLFWTK